MADKEASLAEKHREVQQWLQSIYGDQSAPSYEVTDTTVDILLAMARQHSQSKAQYRALTELCHDREAQYRAEGARLADVCQQLGATPECLSGNGVGAQQALARLACVLGLRDLRKGGFLAELGLLSARTADVQGQLQQIRATNRQLEAAHQSAEAQLATMKRTVQRLEEEGPAGAVVIERCQHECDFYVAKAAEYVEAISELQAQLQATGHTADTAHPTLHSLAKDVADLRRAGTMVRAEVEKYHQLPPDVSLAMVRIEELKMRLKELEDKIHQIDVDTSLVWP